MIKYGLKICVATFFILTGASAMCEDLDAVILDKIIDFYEKSGLDDIADIASDKAALEFGAEFQKSFEDKFDIRLPKKYTVYAEDCYRRKTTWPKYKDVIRDNYQQSFSLEELQKIQKSLSEVSSSTGIPLGHQNEISIEKFVSKTMMYILESKRDCFDDAKNNARSFYIESIEGLTKQGTERS